MDNDRFITIAVVATVLGVVLSIGFVAIVNTNRRAEVSELQAKERTVRTEERYSTIKRLFPWARKD